MNSVVQSYLLSDITVFRWTLFFKVKKGGSLPPFSGSMVRGIFGRALKKAFCVAPHGVCARCLVSSNCGYYSLFQSESESDASKGFRYKPHPYIFHLVPSQSFVEADEVIRIGFTLLGDHAHVIPYLVHAFRYMGSLGFGSEKLELELIDIEFERPDLGKSYSFSDSEFDLYFPLSKAFILPSIWTSQDLIIEFITPFRIQKNGKDLHEITTEDLMRAISIRYTLLMTEYGVFIEEDLKDLGTFSLQKINSNFKVIERYSYRQRRKHKIPGIIGTYLISGASQKLYQILQRFTILHLGKNTTFGLGKFALKTVGEIN